MDFINEIFSNWSVVLFIGGAVFNIGYTWAVKDALKKKVEELEKKCTTLDSLIQKTNTDYSELKGDLKAINTKLDLLLGGKIK